MLYRIVQIIVETYYTNTGSVARIGGKLGRGNQLAKRAVGGIEEEVGSGTWLSRRSFAVCR
jgi:hypothetical protein